MDDQRPSPEALLAQVKMEEARKTQGSLKVFFGAAPGVGKTYAMLEAARQKQSEGVEVVVAVVETHKRKETEKLLEGLEVLQKTRIEYRGAVLYELDIDEALRRKPSLILVDELAHTNAPESRHKKRWQDVFELLEAGIDVYTTLNVQHLESLGDVVAQITGITIRETVPDFVIERADEVALVDLPPDELLQRLKEGKVYMSELADQARGNFFRKGNLLALRELALRRTAERVDEQIQDYRVVKGVKEVWPVSERILVSISSNPRSIRLIRAAKRMAAGLRAEWMAVNVEAPSKVKPTKADLAKLSTHIRLAEELGAETITLTGQRASDEILRYAASRNVTKIIIGKPAHPRWKDVLFGSMLDEIVRGSGNIDIYVISGDRGQPIPEPVTKIKKQNTMITKDIPMTVATVAVCTVVAHFMDPYVARADLAMVYLIGVVFMATRSEKLSSFLTALLGVLAFDFFFVPPRYTFEVSSTSYLITFFVMLVLAFVISKLTLRVKDQVDSARERQQTTASLYNLSRKLVNKQSMEQVCALVISHIAEILSCRAVVLLPDEHGVLESKITTQDTFELDQKEYSVAKWCYDHKQRAGFATDTLSGAKAMYLPLVASAKTIGVIGVIMSPTQEFLEQRQMHILESFANQSAMAIERVLLADEAQQALLKAETETLRNTLLSSISHDLRTPLAAITGAASTILQKDITLDYNENQELLLTIYEEAEHLNQIIRNVLNMTRIEAGAITVKKQWQPIEEIIGAALNRMAEKLGNRPVEITLPEDLPMVFFDPLLIEQVLMNLLDNAIKYTPSETPIELSAMIKDDSVVVQVRDRGPGLIAGEEQRIFDKFVRSTSKGGGIGLGLTICRAIINAHGGKISAQNRPGGGAEFSFTLPVINQPDMTQAPE
ncbi:MAG: sensor histidine kinase KdpD [Nitrospirae bacterium]|nr:sensor histidine kinase KdpD [Nitrospirota bacterium]MBF0534502.1 sensor histidine kinase KdpD [Nitrospirota bacterium]MBF0617128.1 sensor histidine kinase KdpD [Nitrospirota bacterium]